jgi:hypothetical protein
MGIFMPGARDLAGRLEHLSERQLVAQDIPLSADIPAITSRWSERKRQHERHPPLVQ